jgi:ribosome-associated protein
MTSDTNAKKDIQKLQRAIVDGLEDVKGQDIVVFNTETLSPLFERVIIASGTSNRQTKALASSVRDAVREAGFDKPRIEGEDNGEWIIVDCGAAVAHIMQPSIRQYYHLEELWGDKPIKLKLGAPAPKVKRAVAAPEAAPVSAKKVVRRTAPSAAAKKAQDAEVTAKKAPAKKAATKSATKAAPKSAPIAAPKSAPRVAAKPAAKTAAPAAKKAPAKKVPTPKTVTIKASAPKTASKKAPAKKAPAKTRRSA